MKKIQSWDKKEAQISILICASAPSVTRAAERAHSKDHILEGLEKVNPPGFRTASSRMHPPIFQKTPL
jgi:hypothetical protein